MSLKKLDDNLTVSGQILPTDVKTLGEQGYKALICNRPDGEAANQPSKDEMEAAAQQAGLTFHYIPVTRETLSPQIAAEFGKILSETDGKVHAYCGSGARSTMLWQLSQNHS